METPQDRNILRRLAGQVAEIAALPIHEQTIREWKRLNRLGKGRPLVRIDEIPWHEMDVDGELTLQTTDPFCRAQEEQLRRTLYQWKAARGDMVVEPRFYCPLVVADSGFGIAEDVDILRTDAANSVISRRYHCQIQREADVLKIEMPQVAYDAEATERNVQRLVGLFGDILPIEKRGEPGFWFAPWDLLVRWWGVETLLLDLVLKPDLVHLAIDRLVSAHLCRLDQYEQLGLLALNNGNDRVGSGGLGYSDQLPQPDFAGRVRPADLWGFATAQIFAVVSPEMHEEFALRYEIRWLERFGLNYYGCCDPLHRKVHILKSIPNLLKISMSPWIDVEEAVANVGDRYVFSHKPNPAILAGDDWNPERARRELRAVLERARGCVVEVILKDISTVRYEPQRLWEWARIAKEETAS